MLKKIIIAFIFILSAALLIAMPEEFAPAVTKNLSLCAKKVIPSLFLFSVLSNFALNSGALEILVKLFAPVMRLWGLSENCFEALFWGSFSGFPVGARITASLYEKGQITKSEGENLLSFCNNCSPVFLTGILKEYGLKVYFIQLACALLTGLVICSLSPATVKNEYTKASRTPLAESFVNAVKNAALGMINICAFITFMAFVDTVLKLCNISSPLILGFFEITSGLASIPFASPFYFACACALCGFGSVSVLLQTLSFSGEARLSAKKYLLGKAINGALCFIAGCLYLKNRTYLMFSGVIILIFLRKIGKTIFGEKNVNRQFSKKHRAYKAKNEKQPYL